MVTDPYSQLGLMGFEHAHGPIMRNQEVARRL